MLLSYSLNSTYRAMAGQCRRQAMRSLPSSASWHQTCVSNYSSISSIDVAERTKRLLDAKAQSGLSYDDLASKLGVTNTYAAQLLLGQDSIAILFYHFSLLISHLKANRSIALLTWHLISLSQVRQN